MKFNRGYKCIISNPSTLRSITISDLTCNFDIKKGIGAGLNNATLKFYNLSAYTRDSVAKDRFDQTTKIDVNFQVGHNDNLSTCFSGSILEASSRREGTDYVTEIQCRDGGALVDTTYISESLQQITEIEVARLLIKKLGLNVGFFNVEDIKYESLILDGKIFQILKDRYGNNFHIEDGVGSVIKENDVKGSTFIRKIDSGSGLLGTPRKRGNKLFIKVLLEPQITINELVTVISNVESRFNGTFKAIAIHHVGIVSPVKGGTAITELELLINNGQFNAVNII